MENNSAPKFLFMMIILAFAGYIIWSQLEFSRKDKIIDTQQKRLYNIADNFELWKKMITEHDGKIDIELLAKDSRNIQITKIEREELSDNENSDLYIMFYDAPNKVRKDKLDKYFSDLVLGNYFYIITSKDKQIKEMFWDKP